MEKHFNFERVYIEAFLRYDLQISPIWSQYGSLHPGNISTQSVEPFSRYQLLTNFKRSNQGHTLTGNISEP
jgi:hypothetical protein